MKPNFWMRNKKKKKVKFSILTQNTRGCDKESFFLLKKQNKNENLPISVSMWEHWDQESRSVGIFSY